MGHCEEATTYLAIQINFKQMFLKLNKNNFITDKKLLIVDSNGNLNEDFYEYMSDVRWKTQIENKELTFEELEKLLNYSIWNDEYLSLPVYRICKTERWGYSREGINTSSTDLNLVEFNQRLNECEKYISENPELEAEIVWLVKQESG